MTIRSFSLVVGTLWWLAGQVAAGPILSVNIASLQNDADLVCVGSVTSVTALGKETITVSRDGANIQGVEADILEAQMNVSSVVRGEAAKQITIRCHRNLQAWIPGISEGAYVAFLKREADHFVPVHELAYLIPLDEVALEDGNRTLDELLKTTVAHGKSDLVRPAMDALSQIMPSEEFATYADQLTASSNEYVAGVAHLYLLRAGQTGAVPRAQSFIDQPRHDKETRNLAAEISHSLEKSTRKKQD